MRAGTNELVRIGSDGAPINLGAVTGLPSSNYISGDISPAGDYYVKAGGTTSVIYRINLANAPATATAITLSQGIAGADMAWVGGSLYGVVPTSADASSPNMLYRINPSSGAVTAVGSTTGTNAVFGALFGATTGLYGNANDGSGFFKFDLATGAATKISDTPGATENDGAHCSAAAINLSADLGITKTDNSDDYVPGTNVAYAIVVTNHGPFGVQGASVSDPLPSGITTASWTCAVNAGAPAGTSCGTTSGTGAISQSGVNLPVSGAVTYTYTVSVPANRTADLSNTATVTAPAGIVEPSPDTLHPNSATDTSTRRTVDLRIDKTSSATGPLLSGTQVTYLLTVSNVGTTTVPAGTRVLDTPNAGLSCPDPGLTSPAVACTNVTGTTGCASATYPYTTLTTSPGIALGAMAAGDKVELTVVCKVN